MSSKKLTPPANAPKIPKGWVYMGVDWDSRVPVRYAVWYPGNTEWDGVNDTHMIKTGPGMGNHYITPAAKPAPAKAKRAGKPVKARCSCAIPGSNTMHSSKATARYYAGFSANEVARLFVLPADADSVARMVAQVATVLAGTSGTNMSDEDVAKGALAAIGITGRRK